MATENEEVKYSFQGDVGSLRNAVSQALSLLGKYENTVRQASTAADFSASRSSINSFNRSMRSTISNVNALVSSLNSMDASGLQQMTQYTSQLNSASQSLETVLDFLGTGAVSTSKDMQTLTSFLQEAKQAIGAVAAKATGLGSTYQELKQPMFEAGATAVQQGQQMQSAFSLTAEGARDLVNQVRAADYASYFEEQNARVTKSAKESATAMMAAFSQTAGEQATVQFGNTIGDIVGKINSMKNSITMVVSDIIHRFDVFKSAVTAKVAPVVGALKSVFQAFRRAGDGADDAEDDVSDEGDAQDKAASKADKNAKAHKSLSSAFQKASSVSQKLKSKMDELQDTLGKISSTASKVGKALLALVDIQIGNALADAAKSSIDFVETENLFNVAMGESVDVASEFIDRMSEIYGMDPKSLMDTTGVFYLMTDAIHAPAEASQQMALSLTKAANDIASLYNTDIKQVTDNLQSGMQGMSRAVRKYGFDIRSTTLQQTALNYGLTENVQEMSEANRQALRYITMMEQMRRSTQQLGQDVNGNTIIMGDFANTIESPANQLRILKEQIVQLGRAISNFLINPLVRVIAYVNGFVMALRTAINFLSSLVGAMDVFGEYGTSKTAEDTADAVSEIGNAAGSAAKKVEGMLAPFDELNILKEESGSGSSVGEGMSDEILDPALLQAINDMSLGLEDIQMKANKVRDSILNALGFTYNADGEIIWDKDLFKESLEKVFPTWKSTIEEAFQNWDISSIGQIAGVIVSGGLQKFADWIDWDRVGRRISAAVSKFTAIVNSTFATIRGEDIGRAVGEPINTIFNTVAQLISEIDWSQIGVVIGEGISSIFTSIDWTSVGTTMAIIPATLVPMLGQAIATIDWGLVATSVLTALDTAFQTLFSVLTEYGPMIIEGGSRLITNLTLGIAQAAPSLIASFVSTITTLVETLVAQAPAFLAATLTLVQSVATSLISNLPILVKSLTEIIMELLHTIIGAIPDTIDTVMEVLDALLDQLPNIILSTVDAAGQIIGALVAAILAAIPDLVRAGVQLLTSLIAHLPEIITTIVAAIPQIIVSILDGFAQNIDNIATAGFELITALVAALPEIIGTIITAVPEIIKGLIKAFGNMLPQIVDVGKNLVSGLWQGIVNAKDWLISKVSGWASDFIGKVKGFFKIGSPSKVFEVIGKFNVQGMAVGIDKAADDASDAFYGVYSDIINQTDKFDSRLANTFNNGIQDAFSGMSPTDTLVYQLEQLYDSILDKTQTFLTSFQQTWQTLTSVSGTYQLAAVGAPTAYLGVPGTVSDFRRDIAGSSFEDRLMDKLDTLRDDDRPLEVKVFLDGKQIDRSFYNWRRRVDK